MPINQNKSFCVEVDWPAGGMETVPLGDPSLLSEGDELCTLETTEDIQDWYRYFTRIESISDDGSGNFTIVLRYSKDEQTGTAKSSSYWGTSTISIETESLKATATWRDDRGDMAEFSGQGVARLLSMEKFSERGRATRTTASRDKTITKAIHAIDVKCVVTGQTESAALEVAHIIEVKNGGSDAIDNCMLLRADLHRLFDAGLLVFTSTGQVDAAQLPEGYQKELEGKKLFTPTFNRVKDSLAIRGGDTHK